MSYNKQRIRLLDLQEDAQAAMVLALQQASYRIEADLIGYADLPPLLDTLATLKACGETFIGCFSGAELTGAASYKLIEGGLDIHRMMVHPNYFRQGIAQALLHHLRQTAMTLGAAHLIVATGSDNLPACTLYQRFGFHIEATEEVAPGLFITHYVGGVSTLSVGCQSRSKGLPSSLQMERESRRSHPPN